MASNVYQMPPPPMGRAAGTFPTTSGTWAWNGGTQQWTVLPSGTSQVYGWDGTSQSWVPVTGGGSMGDRQGITDGSNAAPGMIGELVTAASNPVTGVAVNAQYAVPTPVWTNLCQVILTAGDWDVGGSVVFRVPPPIAGDFIAGGVDFSTTPAPGAPNMSQGNTAVLQADLPQAGTALATQQINVTATTTVYCLGYYAAPAAGDSGRAGIMWGYIHARRMR